MNQLWNTNIINYDFSSDSFEIQINGKLIFSKIQLGHFPDIPEMVEITKWGNKVMGRGLDSFLKLSFAGQVLPPHVLV